MQEAMMTLVLVILATLAQQWRKYLQKKNHYAQSKDFQLYQDIIIQLNELKNYTGASRVYLLEFHNGVVYSLSTPLWKISCSYEVMNFGIQSVKDERTNVLATSLVEWLQVIFGDEHKEDEGVIYTDCSQCEQCDKNHKVVGFDVETMDHEIYKTMLTLQGVKGLVHAPIVDNDNIIGILGLDYCDESQWVHIKGSLNNVKCEIRNKASIIGFQRKKIK